MDLPWLPLRQPSAYHYGLDSLALLAFIAQQPDVPQSWCDLGAGCGILASACARFWPDSSGLALERQPEFLTSLQHNLPAGVEIVIGDVRDYAYGKRDLFVCNPPYFPPNRKKSSPTRMRDTCRQTWFGGLNHFWQAVQAHLNPGGSFYGIGPPPLVWPFLAPMEGFYEAKPIASFVDQTPSLICFRLGQMPLGLDQTPLILFDTPGCLSKLGKRFFEPVTKLIPGFASFSSLALQ
ncbi:MAG: methyltransferase [Acidobacteria bacterium]|nr:methyltransferase [Acidobacteriota bacterium]MCB9396405.1 methyltransferase [Acidobacteriota bacterium]